MKPEVEVMESIYERIERDGLASLTEAERFYRAIWFLEGETNNGAFHQFFSNDTGPLAHEALAGLRAVGANAMAECLNVAIGLFPGGIIPEDFDERNLILDSMSEQQEAKMRELSARFTDYPDDLQTLLDEYVKVHDAAFRGPRTVLDLWRSKRNRGADTTPDYVIRKIDFTLEAERDRPYSSRPCPMCDYPSPDYRECCKKCGFPLGKVR